MAKVHNSLRTDYLDDFRCRSAVAETTDFVEGNHGKVDDCWRVNHLDDFRHRSAIAATTDFFNRQCSKD